MFRRVPTLFIGMLLSAVCSVLAASPSVAQQSQDVSLGIGGRTLFSYLPLTLTDRLGYFRDEGLAVRINDFQGGSKSLEALVGGSIDFVAGAYENALFMKQKGVDLKAVALLTDRFGLVFALNKELAAKYKSPEDIRGKKIGVTAPGSAVSNALEIILAKGGMTPKDVAMIGIGGGAGAVAAVKSGQVDGLVLSDPAITRLEQDGVITAIVDSRTEEGQKYLYGGPSATSSIYTTAKFAAENPKVVQAFVNAFVRTMKWMSKASLDEIMAAVPPEFYGQDKEIYRKSLAANMDGFSKDGHLTLELATATYKSMASSGRLATGAIPDLPSTIDDSFWKAANGR